jgi:hypothetical protein
MRSRKLFFNKDTSTIYGFSVSKLNVLKSMNHQIKFQNFDKIFRSLLVGGVAPLGNASIPRHA